MRDTRRVRAVWFIVGIVIGGSACGGGKAQPAKPEGAEAAGKPAAAVDPYCEGYRGCAKEKAFYELQAEQAAEQVPEGTDVPDAEVEAAVRTELERCQGIVEGLKPEQLAWLESCTGCGGSCDVYRCLDDVPADASKPFECSMGESDTMEQ